MLKHSLFQNSLVLMIKVLTLGGFFLSVTTLSLSTANAANGSSAARSANADASSYGQDYGQVVKVEKLSEAKMTGALKSVRDNLDEFKRLQVEALLATEKSGTLERLKGSPVILEQLRPKAKDSEGGKFIVRRDSNGATRYYLRTLYEDGKFKLEAETDRNRVLNGNAVLYYPNGDIASIVAYKNGLKDGYFLIYGNDRKKAIEGFYKEGKKDSLERRFYANAVVEWETQYQNGLMNGIEKHFNDDGKLISSISYVNGKKHGWSEYYDNGVLTSKIEFINDKPTGAYVTYNEDGTIQREVPRSKAAKRFENEVPEVTKEWSDDSLDVNAIGTAVGLNTSDDAAQNAFSNSMNNPTANADANSNVANAHPADPRSTTSQHSQNGQNGANAAGQNGAASTVDDGEYVEMKEVESTDKAVTGAVEYIPKVYDAAIDNIQKPTAGITIESANDDNDDSNNVDITPSAAAGATTTPQNNTNNQSSGSNIRIAPSK